MTSKKKEKSEDFFFLILSFSLCIPRGARPSVLSPAYLTPVVGRS